MGWCYIITVHKNIICALLTISLNGYECYLLGLIEFDIPDDGDFEQ